MCSSCRCQVSDPYEVLDDVLNGKMYDHKKRPDYEKGIL